MPNHSASNGLLSTTSDLEGLSPPQTPAILDHILEQRLISSLSKHTRTSHTYGFVTSSLAEVSEIFQCIADQDSRATHTMECLSKLTRELYSTNGNFTTTLPVKTWLETPFFPHYQTIQVLPFEQNCWRVTLGNGVVSPELHQAIKKPVLSRQERRSWGLNPIPGTHGLMAFSSSAAAHVLLENHHFDEVINPAGSIGGSQVHVRHQDELFTITTGFLEFYAPSLGSSMIAEDKGLSVFRSSEFPLKPAYRPRLFMEVSLAPHRALSPFDDPAQVKQASEKLQILTDALCRVVDAFFGHKSAKHRLQAIHD